MIGLFDFTIRIYQASADRATDVAGIASLARVQFTPMSKRLVIDLNLAVSGHIDNIEAAAWGPRLADGRRTLVLASDDNFASNQVQSIHRVRRQRALTRTANHRKSHCPPPWPHPHLLDPYQYARVLSSRLQRRISG